MTRGIALNWVCLFLNTYCGFALFAENPHRACTCFFLAGMSFTVVFVDTLRRAGLPDEDQQQ